MDCELIETPKVGRALPSGGYQYLRIRKGIEGQELLAMLSSDMCSQLETTTVGDQLKGSADQREMSAGQVSIWRTTVRHDKRIP